MKFNQITCVDNVGLEGWALEELQNVLETTDYPV